MVDNLVEAPILEIEYSTLSGIVLDYDKPSKVPYEPFRQQLVPLIEEAISQITEERGMRAESSLAEHRKEACIYNDVVADGLKEQGLKVEIAWSEDTGRFPDGQPSPEVVHEHGVVVSPIPGFSGKVAVVDVSCAQFTPVNQALNQEVLIIIVERNSLIEALQRIYGGGEWQLDFWD